jgi:TPR repeat protein
VILQNDKSGSSLSIPNFLTRHNLKYSNFFIHLAAKLKEFAKSDDSIFLFLLGFCFYFGIGFDQNHHKVISYFTLSSQLGYSRAFCGLGYCFFMVKEFQRITPKLLVYLKLQQKWEIPKQSVI